MPGMDATYNYRGIFEDLPGEFRKEAGAGIVDAIAMDMDIFSRVTYHKIEIMPEETGGISRTGRGVASAVQPRIHGTFWGCLPAWGKTLYRRDTGERQ